MIKLMSQKPVRNIVFLVAIVIVFLTNIWSDAFSKLLYLKPDITTSDVTQIHFISVGQGDAIAIKFSNGKTMLIDSGTELYKSKLTRYLDNIVLENNRIDYLVLTHPDSDHSGNMEYIASHYDIGVFYRPPVYLEDENPYNYTTKQSYANLLKTLKEREIPVLFNDDGNVLEVGEDMVRWLYPNVDSLYPDTDDGTNVLSAVMILESGNKRAMFTGDITSDIERLIINTYDEADLDVDILKVAHHGSNTSTSSDFLSVTSPDVAVVSVGDNSYGHPSSGMLERVREYDTENNTSLFDNIYRTDTDGNVIVHMTSNLKIETIDNIDKYSFSSYFVYTILLGGFLAFLMLRPYLVVYYKEWKYIRQNKKQEKLKKKESIE